MLNRPLSLMAESREITLRKNNVRYFSRSDATELDWSVGNDRSQNRNNEAIEASAEITYYLDSPKVAC